MSFFSKIKDGFAHLFTAAEHTIIDFSNNMLNLVKKNGGPLLVQAAKDAVAAAEATGGSGKDKFSAATASVIATLSSKGVAVLTTAAEGAVLMAVANMNSDAGK